MKKEYKNETRDIVKMKTIIGEIFPEMKNESYLKLLFETENIKIKIKQEELNGDIIQLRKENKEINIFLDSIGIYFKIELDEEIKERNFGTIIRKLIKGKTLLDLIDAVAKLNLNVCVLKFSERRFIAR